MSAFIAAFLCLSCNKEQEEPLVGSGISSATWSSDGNSADAEGEILNFSFQSSGKWTAVSEDESWCKTLTPNGVAGASTLRLRVSKNTLAEARSVKVTVAVEGYPQTEQLTVNQDKGVTEAGDGRYREVNAWIYDTMAEYYLWNEPIPSLSLDYSVDYQTFFTSILDGVADCDDVNHDDGYWKNKKRMGYYSQLSSNAPVTRAVGDRTTGSGLYLLQATYLGTTEDYVGIVVMAVTPGTPAAEAGLKRGDFINKVDGASVTDTNYQEMVRKLYAGPATVAVNDVSWSNGSPHITPRGEVYVGSDTYVEPAVYKDTVLNIGGKKVAYLLYMGFDVDYDEDLIETFDGFRSEGVQELILDLRYNGGGDVLSSVVLGTLIMGNDRKGQVMTRLQFNSARTAAGEKGEYKIGEAVNSEMPSGYEPIETALQSSVNLKRVYLLCTGSTASASELVINGLKGLDAEVILIGQTTQGKNVGMEGFERTFYTYPFTLYPVTFYASNAKGFSDYPEGFTPDFVCDDSNIYPGDFATGTDALSGIAMSWIRDGEAPSAASVRSASSAMTPQLRVIGDSYSCSPMAQRIGGSIVTVRE